MNKIYLIKKNITFVACFLVIIIAISSSINAKIPFIRDNTIENDFNTANNEDSYDLLIISPQRFTKVLKPLVDHKNLVGITTINTNLKNIYSQESLKGRDRQEKIKYFIKYAIENWKTKYVLLVGDPNHLPARYCHNNFDSSILHEASFVSDLYYADIYDVDGNFSTWDTNNNGVYGEWNGEEAQDKNIDLYPDIGLGRLSCRNIFEVRTVVDKIISYETSTYNKSWFKNMVVVAGDTYPNINNYSEGEIGTQQALDFMNGFNPVKLWASTGDLSYPGGWKIVKAISEGCGFLYFAGHGNPPFWVTHPFNESKWISRFSIFHISLLTNGYKLPICVASGCGNSKIDVNPWNSHIKWFYPFGCWSWHLVRKIGGGAIATIGSTGIGLLMEDNSSGGVGAWSYVAPRFFYEYGINGTDILGEIWRNVISDYLNEFPINWSTPSVDEFTSEAEPDAVSARTVQQYILLGDPSLKIGGYDF